MYGGYSAHTVEKREMTRHSPTSNGNTLFNGPGSQWENTQDKQYSTQVHKQQIMTRKIDTIIGNTSFNSLGSKQQICKTSHTQHNPKNARNVKEHRDNHSKHCIQRPKLSKREEYTEEVIHNTIPKRHRGRTRHSAPIIGNILFKRRDSQARKNNKAQPDRHREQFLRGCLLILPTSLVIIFPFVWRFNRYWI